MAVGRTFAANAFDLAALDVAVKIVDRAILLGDGLVLVLQLRLQRLVVALQRADSAVHGGVDTLLHRFGVHLAVLDCGGKLSFDFLQFLKLRRDLLGVQIAELREGFLGGFVKLFFLAERFGHAVHVGLRLNAFDARQLELAVALNVKLGECLGDILFLFVNGFQFHRHVCLLSFSRTTMEPGALMRLFSWCRRSTVSELIR